jgi:hypothetical protein
MKPAVAALLTSLALVAGCGDETADPAPAAASPTSAPETAGWDGEGPPPLELRADGASITAAQGTSCWGNGCFDSVTPRASELPRIGPAATLEVGFPLPANWGVRIGDDTGFRGCGDYPVLVEAGDDGTLRLSPSGPPGVRVASYFAYAGGGDTSGWWRWHDAPRDGQPLAWVHVNQNSPSSGGMTDLRLVLDDADVDGEVSARVTVTAADGAASTFALPEVDQHCPDDGVVELALSPGTPEQRIDGLGPAPYSYDVSLEVDGAAHTGVGAWSGEGTEHGGDAALTFDPSLPSLAEKP